MGGNGELDLLKQIKESVEKNGADVAKQWGEELRANRAKVREATDQAEVDTEVITKKCTKCGDVKALDSYCAKKDGKYGKESRCKVCARKYRQENKERISDRKRKYHQENRGRINEKSRKYRQENKERLNEQSRKYYEENKEHIAEWMRKYYEENREQIVEYKRKYHEENKESLAEYRRKYDKENPEVGRRANRKRRALKRNLPHQPLTPQQYEILHRQKYEIFGGNASGN